MHSASTDGVRTLTGGSRPVPNEPDGASPSSNGARVPPHNLDAEEALLGACLLSYDAVTDTIGTLNAGDFYRPAHGHVWASIAQLSESLGERPRGRTRCRDRRSDA